MKKLRVLVLMHEDLVPPDSLQGVSEEEMMAWKAEFDVVATLREMGHEARPLGVRDELSVVRSAILDGRPHIAFNLLEEFHGVGLYDQHVVSYLELMKQPYSGCNPRGLMLTHDKPLMKKILAFHRIRSPRFTVFTRHRKIVPGRQLSFPLLVKSTTEDASLGISADSVVHDDKQLKDRVHYVHERIQTDAIAEEYIEGREIYMGVLGNQRLQTLPVWEMHFSRMPEDVPRIATAKVKWDIAYQKKHGIRTAEAKNLPPGMEREVAQLSRRAYRALHLSGYARMDYRLSEEGQLYLLEANANPNLSYGEDFAESAHAIGLPYDALLQRIVNLGLRYQAAWQG